MIVLVCGGRDFSNRALLHATLNELDRSSLVIVHGAARGADTLAGEWAASHGVECRVYPARWVSDGRAAGPIRNQRMLDLEHPDRVIAFPGGTGTLDMIARARRARVRVTAFQANGSQIEW